MAFLEHQLFFEAMMADPPSQQRRARRAASSDAARRPEARAGVTAARIALER
jgi:hypothetical protein